MFFSSILLASSLSLASETQCLTRIIYHEARGERYTGQIAVGLVVKNRVLSNRYPDSICGVEADPYQFSYVHLLDDQGMNDKGAREASCRAAQTVLSSTQWPSMGGATLYHTTAVKPSWNYSKIESRGLVGNHQFYSCIDINQC